MPRTRIHLVIFTAICIVAFAIRPASHGLTNWQEAKRALVAREMSDRLASDPWAWAVPTDNGEPYLAKPPLMYWVQIAICRVRGADRPTELDLRLTVALAGWLGVIATYFCARRLLAPADGDPSVAATRALWSALLLTTGVLYTRSSRIGELDILLVPSIVLGTHLIHIAWDRSRADRKTHLLPLAGAAICAVLAALTKGPPAVLAFFIAAYGGTILSAAMLEGTTSSRRRVRIGAALAGWTTLAISASTNGLGDPIGLVLLGLIAAACGALVGRLVDWNRFKHLILWWSRTHPVGVVAIPLLTLYGWSRLVAWRVGTSTVSASIAEEAEDNLRLLVPESPLNNLEALGYGAGLASLCAIAAIGWIFWARRSKRSLDPTPHLPSVLAWLGLGLAMFSLLGKGVPRYLTPLWPAVAMLGAWWLVSFMRDAKHPRVVRTAAWTLVILIAASYGWSYGWGREMMSADRSPRGIVNELREELSADELESLVSFEFSTPALDYYIGQRVESILNDPPRKGIRFVGPRSLSDLHTELAQSGGSRVMLIRRTQPPGMEPVSALECLDRASFDVEAIPINTPFTIDNSRTSIDVVRIKAKEFESDAGEPARAN